MTQAELEARARQLQLALDQLSRDATHAGFRMDPDWAGFMEDASGRFRTYILDIVEDRPPQFAPPDEDDQGR